MGRKVCYYSVVISVCLIAYSWAGMNVPGTFLPTSLNGINWVNIKNIDGGNINWTDVRVFATSHGGDHSGINWQSLGV